MDDLATWNRDIAAGTIRKNSFADGFAEPPFGGYNNQVGRELGRHSVLGYTEEKALHIHSGPRTPWWLSPPSKGG